MAERPDLEYWVPWLARELVGARVVGVQIDKPVVLRIVVRGAFVELVGGAVIGAITRRGNFVLVALEGEPPLELAISAMLAGRFRLVDAASKERLPADRAVTFTFDDGRRLVYRDDVQMGKVYLLARGAYKTVPGLGTVGVDCLDPKAFTRARFREIAKARRDQVKVFLMDKAALDFFGNAYADEALFAAGIHPKAFVRALSDAQLDALHDAIVSVLEGANAQIAQRKPPLDVKLRDFLSVRLHAGEPCPRCSTLIRKAGVHGHDAFFCPNCQPDGRGTGIVDWRKLGVAGVAAPEPSPSPPRRRTTR